jgi:DNA polymerase
MPFQPVAGIGPRRAQICVVGEAPGQDESIAEEPFVGACGRFLTTLLKEAGIERENVYILNTVNCRPTIGNLGKKNRTPNKNEIKSCKSWMYKQIYEVKP